MPDSIMLSMSQRRILAVSSTLQDWGVMLIHIRSHRHTGTSRMQWRRRLIESCHSLALQQERPRLVLLMFLSIVRACSSRQLRRLMDRSLFSCQTVLQVRPAQIRSSPCKRFKDSCYFTNSDINSDYMELIRRQ